MSESQFFNNRMLGRASLSRLAIAASLPMKPSTSTIEKAYVRGLKEGMRRGEARRVEIVARKAELGIRYKSALGEVKRLEMALARIKDDLVEINLFSDTEEERLVTKELLDRLSLINVVRNEEDR